MSSNPSVVLLVKEGQRCGMCNMLGSSFVSLKRAFDENAIPSYWLTDNIQNPGASLGFNAAGEGIIDNILNAGFYHFLWTVDSSFYQNFQFISKYINHPNFHLLLMTKSDIAPLRYFYPEFKNYHYMPHAVDPEDWKYQNEEKDLDIVYVATVREPESIIKTTKENLPGPLFDTFMDMFKYLKKNPHGDIWQLYKGEFLNKNYAVPKEQQALVFNFFFKQMTYLLSYTKRIELVKSLEDVGMKIWGTPEWAKYTSGKNEYMGPIEFEDSLKILPRAKVALNLQPLQLIGGLHERLLNATLTECAVLCDGTPEIQTTFGDSLAYYDIKNFSNIKQKAIQLLSDKELREQKVKKAKEIILKDYTWVSRTKAIYDILQQKNNPVLSGAR